MKLYQYYQEVIHKFAKRRNIDTKKLGKVLLELDTLYRFGKPTGLTDDEYDQLNSIYIELTGKVIDGEHNARSLHDYPDLKGTLKKVHYVSEMEKLQDPNIVPEYKTLEDWVYRTYKILSSKPRKSDPMLGFYFKYDGVSVVLSLNGQSPRRVTKAITRGYSDRDEGVDKTALFANIAFEKVVPEEFDKTPIGLKCEAVVSYKNYEKYNEIYGGGLADPRAAAVSLMSSDAANENISKYLTLVPLLFQAKGELRALYDMDNPLTDPLFIVPITSARNLQKILEATIAGTMEYIKKKFPFPADGIVVRWIDDESIKTLGRDKGSNTNNFEVAYKFRPPVYYSRVIDIIQDIGYMGNASFTVEFEPVKIDGRNISHASLGSYERAKAMKLGVGDMIGVMLNTVPKVILDEECRKNKGPVHIKLMKNCPYCGEPLKVKPVLACFNPECPSRIKGKIYNFVSTMKIKTIGPTTIDDLFRNHYLESIKDLFSIEANAKKIKKLEGYGDGRVDKMIKEINSISTTEDMLLGSIGIPGVRVKTISRVMDKYTFDELMNMPNDEAHINKLAAIEGIGYSTASAILEGIYYNRELIDFLMKTVKVKPRYNTKNAEHHVCFTGFRNQEFAEHLMKGGVAVEGSFNKSVTLLIAANPDDTTSKKVQKARTLGIPVISVNTAFEMFGFKN